MAVLDTSVDFGITDVSLFVDGKFTYAPHVLDTAVQYLPIDLESITDNAIIETIVTVNGTYTAKDRALDAVEASLKAATLEIYSGTTLYTTVTLDETIASKTTAYTVDLPEGEYTFKFLKTGYVTETVNVTVAEEMADLDEVTAYAGDIEDSVEGKNDVVDLGDFIRLIRGFDAAVATDDYIEAADLDETGIINIEDLVVLKTNFGYPNA